MEICPITASRSAGPGLLHGEDRFPVAAGVDCVLPAGECRAGPHDGSESEEFGFELLFVLLEVADLGCGCFEQLPFPALRISEGHFEIVGPGFEGVFDFDRWFLTAR